MPLFHPRPPSRRGARLLVALQLAALLTAAAAQGNPPRAPRVIPPWVPARMVVPEARLPIQLRHVDVHTEIVGLAATTRVELEFHNPNARVLEGELQFPLLDGQSIAGFALDIDGELRPAVPVEKAKGQQVFEEVTRGRVDPALLEATQGNNYRLRVYPLPAQGTRRVVLEIAETLASAEGANRLNWRLPLQFSGPVARLDVDVRVAGAMPLAAQLGAMELPLTRGHGTPSLSFTRTDYQGQGVLQVALPAAAPELALSVEDHRDRTYFYAEVQVPAHTAPRTAPARIALIWDASGSGAGRDHGKEFAVLDQYFKTLGPAHARLQVQLLAVRDVASPVETFVIADGDWQALRRRLEAMVYDGATQLGAMQPPAGAELALLFTDGLGNYGATPLVPPSIPLYALSATASADATLLRQVAERSGGAYLDLLGLPTAAAVQALTTERTRLAGLRGTGAGELESSSAYVQDGRITIAGVLTEPQAQVELDLQAPGGSRSTRVLKLKSPGTAAPAALAARRWATLRLATLAADPQRHRAAMRRLGQDFGLVSSETSLIVLDSVADYARYQIEPPASLRAAWQELMQHTAQRDAAARSRHLDQVAAEFAARVAWWETDFPKDRPPVAEPKQERALDFLGAPTPAAAAPPSAPPQGPSAQALASAPERQARQERRKSDGKGDEQMSSSLVAGPSIQLRKWQPNEPYARRLRDARPADLYAIYLDERPAYAASTAFFLDVADLLFERGQPELAARVLSNLAEMNLENRHVLRILAYRLVQARLLEQAVPVLEKVLALGPDEPQSYRDLGLALARAGQPQRAIHQLWEVVSRPWDGRFPGIEAIALGELNAIVATHPALDTGRIDPRLLRNLPLDLRAVLAWDADNTDIDLWVTDPNGEQAYYGHRRTYQGGQMSADFTGGYGPEEFALRTAKPGTYTVKARFFGHRQQIVAPATTLMLRLSSGFGTTVQKDEDVVMRLAGRGEEVTVGTFTVGAKPRP